MIADFLPEIVHVMSYSVVLPQVSLYGGKTPAREPTTQLKQQQVTEASIHGAISCNQSGLEVK